ncbi:MAG: helix-turn-helix domain-containing protein [Polyangiaceae bacterium]
MLARRLPLVQARQDVVARFERLYVEQVLRENGGNVTRAAKASGLAHRYSLQAPQSPPQAAPRSPSGSAIMVGVTPPSGCDLFAFVP